MRTTGKATDLITFSRSSGGTALRKIGYGSDVAPLFSAYGIVGSGTWAASGSDYVFEDTVGSQVRPGVSWPTNGLSAGIYLVEVNIASITGATQVRVDGIGAADQLIGAGENSFVIQLTSKATPRIRIEDTSTSVGDGFALTSFSVKPVLFDQGDLTLFNHPADIPRIEYDANGNVLGLLVEESRTNLVTTADFSSVTWAKANSLVTSGYAGVDGTNGAYLIEPNGSPSYFDVKISSIVAPAASVYTWSCYFKTISADSFQLRVRDPSNITNRTDAGFAGLLVGNPVVSVNSFGDYSGGTASVTEIGSGWWRATVSTTTGATANVRVEVLRTGSPTGQMLIQNPQLEAGAFPTSYIPTSGSTATRAEDSAEILLSEFGANKAAGTFVAEFDYKDPDNIDNNYIGGGLSNARIIYNNAGTNLWQTFDGTAAVTFQGVDGNEQSNKLALAVSTGKDIATAKNGSIIGSSTTATNLMTELHNTATPFIAIGGGSSSQKLNGHIKSIKYIPRRLTNDQLQEITS